MASISQITVGTTTYDVKSKWHNQLITGSGTAASDKGAGVSPRYFPAKWTFNTGANAVAGDTYTIKIPVAGHNYGVFMSVDNGSHYYPVVNQGTSRVTTHYANGYFITVVFDSAGSAASMMALNGADAAATVSGGVFRVTNYYDSNTNTLLRTYASATNIEVPLIGSSSANSTTASWSTYTATYKDWYGAIPNDDTKRPKMNLSTGKVTIPGGVIIKGIAADAPLLTRGINGSDGTGGAGDLYINFAGGVTYFGTNGGANISADGKSYSGNAATATKATQDGDGKTISSTYLKLAGGTMSGSITFGDNNIGIQRVGRSVSWHKGRDSAILKTTSISGYGTIASIKTTNGSWDIGAYNNSSYTDDLLFTYVTDTQYNGTSAVSTAQVKILENGHIVGTLDGNATNVTGIVAAANGGTGKTSLQDSANALLNALSTGSSTPVDADYYISQYVNGGSTTTTYHRRPVSALWTYMQGKADSRYLKLAGGTMTGQLKTSFNSSVAMGTYGSSSTTVPNLCSELRYSSGAAGSANITTAYTLNGITIPTGWYNFLWIPHRSGGVNGAASGDNCNYGTLLLTGMTTSNAYRIQYNTSAIATLRSLDNITWGTSAPSGGTNGDIYLMYGSAAANWTTIWTGTLQGGNTLSLALSSYNRIKIYYMNYSVQGQFEIDLTQTSPNAPASGYTYGGGGCTTIFNSSSKIEHHVCEAFVNSGKTTFYNYFQGYARDGGTNNRNNTAGYYIYRIEAK